MGGEFGQWTEWNYDSHLDWALFGHKYHDALRLFVGDLNRVYRSEPALHQVDFKQEGFRWIEADDYQASVYAYYRIGKDPNEIVVVVANFTPVPRKSYRFGVPRPGRYTEIINSDAAIYGGGNIGNAGAVFSDPIPFHGQAQSIVLTVPPLALLMLKPA
jgi:1,4-alpha-glucan branching enzyme